MNLIDESVNKEKKDNSKKIARIILAFIAVLIVVIIGIFILIIEMKNNILKLSINGVQNETVKQMMVIEDDGTVYFPIKEIAPYLGYESFNGEYADKSEITSKCYIQNENEIANFALNSNKIYKLNISNSSANYDYFYTDRPVKAINGKLYATSDAIEKAFNISFSYNTNTKRITIFTMEYLINVYSSRVLDYGYETISSNFTSQKTVLNDMLVVTKNESKIYGVIDVSGNTIIEPKYDYIEYLPNSGDFLVQSNNKVGIISSNRETKVQILYDSLKLVDTDTGLYLARRDNKYGIIDSKGNIKIYIEYDQIGIDNTKFKENDIKNGYLLDNGMIPVRKDKLWGTFDKNGKQILDFEYDSFGYVATTSKDAINLLMIPDYNLMVVCKNKKYTLVNESGVEIIVPTILDDIYMTISSGKKYYYMNALNQTYNVEEFLESRGLKPTSKQNDSNEDSSNTVDEEEINEYKNSNEFKNVSEDNVEQAEETSTVVVEEDEEEEYQEVEVEEEEQQVVNEEEIYEE